jgi:hypothetical protein
VPGQPGADFFVLVGRIIVDNSVDGLVCGDIALDVVEKPNEFLLAMALHVLPDDGSIQNVQHRIQGGCAVALVIMGLGCPASLLHWQAGLRAIKRLNLELLINLKQERVVGRRNTGRAGLVAKQAIDALRREPLLPAPDASLRLAGRSPDRHRTQPIIAQQNDTSTPDMFLQALGSDHNRLQLHAISQRYREGNTSRHTSESHILGAVKIPNRTLRTQPIH